MSGYDKCRKTIEKARLPEPIVLECMTIKFDPRKLEDARDKFGYDLYIKVMNDIAREEE